MNSVTLLGHLTADPELDETAETPLCRMRLAESGAPSPLYIDVAAFGRHGKNCARFLRKGRQILVAGRLRFREWEGSDGSRRSAISIVAERVQFLSGAKRPPESVPGEATD